MLKLKNCFALLLCSLNAAGYASTTLDFEDLSPAPAAFDVMPAVYNGLTFTGWFFGPDMLYTPGSGTIDLFTDYADPSDPSVYVITNSNNRVTSTTPFVFDGAKFSGYSGVTFQLWNAGTLVHTSASLPDALGADPYSPVFLASGYDGKVDTVVVSGVQGYYSMDDFTYTQAAAVAEPATLLTTVIGLGVLGLARKRNSKSDSN